MNKYFTKILIHVRTGVDMKFVFIVLLLFGNIYLASQTIDSSYVRTNYNVSVFKNQILASTLPKKGGKVMLMHFDGEKWNKISNDSLPTISQLNSRSIISYLTNKIFSTGFYHLWEYDGKDWRKYAIMDSLYEKREFRELIELPDSSLIITAVTEFVKYTSGNITILEKMLHEVLQFKNGEFKTIKSRWTDKNTLVGGFESFQKFKVQPNGNYSYYTPIETPIPDRGWELVTFNTKHEIVKKDTNPELSSFGFNAEFTEFNDYIFDSKGSLWFAVKTIQTDVFACLAEKRANGEVYLYGENIGLPKTTGSFTYCLDLDENDNIWFHHTYRIEFDGGNSKAYHSMFLLDSGRTSLREFKYDEFMKKSKWFNGGVAELNFFDAYNFRTIKYRRNENSLVICTEYPILLFYPYKDISNVKESTITPIHLYPNPVQTSNTITIESSSFENVVNPINVIIRDVSGATIREEIVSSNGTKLQLNSQDLLSGTYFISVLSNNRTILQKSFVKE